MKFLSMFNWVCRFQKGIITFFEHFKQYIPNIPLGAGEK